MQSSKQWLAIKMLKELSEDHHIMKKLQSEPNTTVIEIKNNLQGNNRRVMKPRIRSMIWEMRKQKQNKTKNQSVRTTRRKKNPKKWGKCKQPLGQLQEVQHLHHRGTRRRGERTRNWKSI